MSWDYIRKSNELYKNRHSLKDRNLSILEFQMRIFDIAMLKETPLMEKLKFIKIIHNNMKDFVSIRISDIAGAEVSQMIHTIEFIYQKMAKFVLSIAYKNKLSFDYPDPMYEIIETNSFQYVYGGETSYEVYKEMQELIKIRKTGHNANIMYCIKKPIIKNYVIDEWIHIPWVIFHIDHLIDQLKTKKYSSLSYPTNEKISISSKNYYNFLQRDDILIRVPYEPYDTVINFIYQMASHKNIHTLMISLYRTSEDSEIIRALLLAKENGKNVYVYVEPMARGDEENNINTISVLKEHGIHVSCVYFNYKIHAKLCCAIDIYDKIFCHVGTGNYNETSAKMYTDFHLLTCNPMIGQRILEIFHAIFTHSQIEPSFDNDLIFASPIDFRSKISSLIEREAQKGTFGTICIKCNSLCDCAIIDKLYHAADCGANIRIICRTGCSMRPHKNIVVKSKVGQFLEHDRFYIFGDEVYISSADLLLRNINKRLEVLCKIENVKQKSMIYRTFSSIWNSNYIHIMKEDGSWTF